MVSCLAQKKACDVSLKKALIHSSLLSSFFGMLEAFYTNHTFENGLKEINEKSKFFLPRQEEFQKKDSFIEKLTVFSEAKKSLISGQETNDSENKLLIKIIDLLNKFYSETNQQNGQIEFLEKKITAKNEEALLLRKELSASQENIEKVKAEISTLNKCLEDKKNEIETLKNKTLELEKAKAEFLEKKNVLETEIVKINEELLTKNKEVEGTKIKLFASQSKIVEMQKAFNELESKHKNAEEYLQIKNNELEEMGKKLKT